MGTGSFRLLSECGWPVIPGVAMSMVLGGVCCRILTMQQALSGLWRHAVNNLLITIYINRLLLDGSIRARIWKFGYSRTKSSGINKNTLILMFRAGTRADCKSPTDCNNDTRRISGGSQEVMVLTKHVWCFHLRRLLPAACRLAKYIRQWLF